MLTLTQHDRLRFVCDGRKNISEIYKEFPDFDFSEVENDDDIYYSGNDRESDEHCSERALHFLQWLNSRPEKCIAVVTHSSFLRHLFTQFGGNLAADDQDALQRLAGNCELRSVIMCSHGIKDGKVVPKMTRGVTAPSDVRMGSIHQGLDKMALSGVADAPDAFNMN